MNITNDKVTEYINQYYRPVNQQMAELRREAEERHVPIILRETESFLATQLEIIRPRKILEIGTAIGYSAAFFALKCGKGTRVFTIEADAEKHREARERIESMGLSEQVTLLLGDGAGETEKLFEAGEKDFDLIFIDASKSHYREFWDAAMKVAAPGATVICDNILMKAMTASDEYDRNGRHKTNIRNMRQFVDYITSLSNCSTVITSMGDGLAISRLL